MKRISVIVALVSMFTYVGDVGGLCGGMCADAAVLAAPYQAPVSPLEQLLLTQDGIAGVKTGINYKSLPKSVAGVYDKMTAVTEFNEMEEENYTSIEFTLKGVSMFSANAYEDGVIYHVSLESSKIKAKVGSYIVGLGDSISRVKRIPGVTMDRDGYGYYIYQNMWFDVDINGNIVSISLGSPFM
jgi:hypothetical protein